MTTADKLLEQMFSWIDQRSRCADQLVKLAKELESLRTKCNGAECVGSSVAVVGAACVIGAGLTFLSGGAAAPFLGLLGGTYLGAGAVISVATQLIEGFLSSSTMKDAKKIEEKSNESAKNIQRLFEKLKSEKKEANRFADPDDLDRHILTNILRAVARRSGVRMKINFRMIGDEPNWSFGGGHYSSLSPGLGLNVPILVTITGVLGFFTLSASGKKCNFLFAKGAQQLIKEISVTGLKTVLKGGSMLVGGAIGMAFALPEAIDNWTDLIKNNNVTEASQSLRDTAKAIQKITQALKDQFKDMKRMLEKMEEEQRKQEKVKRIIENPERSYEDERVLIRYAMKTCQNEEVRRWLRENSGCFLKLVALFQLMKNEIIKKSNEDESDDEDEDEDSEVDIIFVAHGSITDSMIPASCLMPLSNIKDVLLYSPWNCLLAADAAYGIATGLIQPRHRQFICVPESGCKIPDKGHRPRKLPAGWNSMKEAGLIPNIMVSTLNVPDDGAWTCLVDLTETYGRPGRGRIVIPFILGGLEATIPFYIVTWVMSLVLSFFRIEATVHLAACLGDESTRQKFPREFLECQYSYTIDDTGMTSRAMLSITHRALYRNLQAMFD
ncbi:uncharacterized protein LOC118104010 [Hippoglossus stenolepis]|uniref:uncharacterized protein LOC118104010 n=1 Tax=Hippoglossus stenolepis TaxID=195615 RepID=UPI00159C90CA|nr:uncharacterized protein LOC118104010 [Hippoglossus stenolepis]XP_035006950.1 uncharacterized protein LOC118104010 [Hippoglossus stenolepis]